MKKLILTCCFPITIFSQIDSNRINQYLDSVMQSRNIPGLSIAVIKEKKVVFESEKGLSNVELNAKVTKSSVFELASLTKPFTGVAILKLVSQGKVNLDHSISKYIDSIPNQWNTITIKNLLNHTSGLPEQVVLSHGFSPVMDVSTKEQFELIKEKALEFIPNDKGLYSDPGYFLLGMIIEKVSNKTYAQFMQSEIFEPIGMLQTQIQDKWKIISNRVSAYGYNRGMLINGRRDYQHELPSHYGVLSTIADLIKWDNALRDYKIINKKLLDESFKPSLISNGDKNEIWGSNYGYGWMLGELKGRLYAEHGGFSGTHLIHFIDKDLTVIVLTNLDLRSKSNPRGIAHYIAGFFLEESD